MNYNPDVLSKLNKDKDAIMSTIVELIENDSTNKQHKKLAIELIQNAKDYKFVMDFTYSTYCLQLCFNIGDYSKGKRESDFNRWKKHLEKRNIFNLINESFKTIIEDYDNDVFLSTTIKAVCIPEDKGLHKRDATLQYYIDSIKSLEIQFSSGSIGAYCKELIGTLERKNYETAISKTRSLIESYHKHLLGISKVDNKTILSHIFSVIDIIPKMTSELNQDDQDKIKEVEENINKIIKYLDVIMRSIPDSLEEIIKSLGNLRNNRLLVSHAHATGPDALFLGENHAYLIVGSALAYINFINKSINEAKLEKVKESLKNS